MYLTHCQTVGLSPFGDVEFPFLNDQGEPRRLTVVCGRGGVGKTSLLQVIAATRPGHATVLMGRNASASAVPYAVSTWSLSDDEPERPHPLVIVTPNVKHPGDEETSILRRREQAHYEKRAREGGFAFCVIPSLRWFSRRPVSVQAPLRSVAHYDIRAEVNFDDASHCDLTRDVKQTLAYAAFGRASAVPEASQRPSIDVGVFGHAMHALIDALVQVSGYRYLGVDPVSWEPTFRAEAGTTRPFHALPNAIRHAVSLGVLPLRTLWASRPGQDPRRTEGVVAIDEFELHQDPATAAKLLQCLQDELPRVQWIVTSSTWDLCAAVEPGALLTLRRSPHEESVQVHVGRDALTH